MRIGIIAPPWIPIPPDAYGGIDRMVIDELKNDDLVKEPESLLLPVDDIVLGTVKHLSNGGSLAGRAPFESVHPDWFVKYLRA